MDMPFTQAEVYLSKLTISHFGTLNTRIGNQNVLKRILIAMHNKNKADCNENFRPFPYEGSISKFRDQIDVSPNFSDSRFRQNVDYKLRFEVLLALPVPPRRNFEVSKKRNRSFSTPSSRFPQLVRTDTTMTQQQQQRSNNNNRHNNDTTTKQQ